jgi:nucleoporin POM34
MASNAIAVTPIKTTPAKSTPAKDSGLRETDSPGNWQHPRLKEINRRKARQTFDERNVRTIAQNVAALLVLLALQSCLGSYGVLTW